MTSATVSGQVLDPHGRPVRGARVYFVRSPVSMPDIALHTDAEGRFTLGTRIAGVYCLGVTAPGYPSLEHDVIVAVGRPITVTLRLEGAK